jgi:imidazolonepropionase-like amidohydrolase
MNRLKSAKGRRHKLRVVCFVLCSWLAHAAATAAESVVFRNVRVFDGSKTIPPTTVVVTDGVISGIGPDAKAPDGAKVVEGAGKTLLPGLIDCHTHCFTAEHLQQAVVFGVTTELDMFTDHAFAARTRSEQQAGKAQGRADLVSSGTLVTAPGGHGTEYGLPIPTITGPQEAQAFVDARIAEGSDYIKIIYDDGSELGITLKTINRPTLAAVIRAAHARQKLAVVHVHAREKARDALEEGVDALVHLFFDEPADEALVRLAVEKKAFVVPTLAVLESVSGKKAGASLANDPALKPFLSPADMRTLNASFPARAGAAEKQGIPAEAVAKLNAAGVPILAGTDCPNPGTAHGASLHRELELLVAAGLTPSQALAAATSLPAEKFHLADRGRIAPGLRADLLLVEGDPTADIKATRAILGVWKQGQAIDRAAYRANVAKQTEQLANAKAAAPPPGSESGLVSDFERGKIQSAFGNGWSISTDVFVGGKSKADDAIVEGGAQNSKYALKISGIIEDRPQPRWAGAMFSPGPSPMAPANLSQKKAISFWAKGDGKTYSVMLFFQANGFAPSAKTFEAGAEWKKHRFELKDFDGCDGSGLMGVFFGGGANVGPFELQIDDVRIE